MSVLAPFPIVPGIFDLGIYDIGTQDDDGEMAGIFIWRLAIGIGGLRPVGSEMVLAMRKKREDPNSPKPGPSKPSCPSKYWVTFSLLPVSSLWCQDV